MRNVLLIASLAVVAAATVGCTASDRPSTQTNANTPTAAAQKSETPSSSTSAATPTGPACTAADFKVAGEFGAKPTVTVPSCAPGKELLVIDLKPGTGAEVKQGSTVAVNYQLTTFSDKKVLDDSFGRGEPFSVANVGQAAVIDGWNQGLVGLKEGGRRLLVVPPDLGYGQGDGTIKPNETLIFVIDAVQVTG
jgi:FKBP-type peptidyl-prolyl cis-trans isomerase